jgi:hypothetical protein
MLNTMEIISKKFKHLFRNYKYYVNSVYCIGCVKRYLHQLWLVLNNTLDIRLKLVQKFVRKRILDANVIIIHCAISFQIYVDLCL